MKKEYTDENDIIIIQNILENEIYIKDNFKKTEKQTKLEICRLNAIIV